MIKVHEWGKMMSYLTYVLIFILREDHVLMLYRNKAPNQHLWNGVGGKLEPGESPEEAAIREVKEETGLQVQHMVYKGIVTWNGQDGMYVFLVDEMSGEIRESEEGRLEWKHLNWVMESPKVVSNIRYFLPVMLEEQTLYEHAFTYEKLEEYAELQDYVRRELAETYRFVCSHT
jgi:8-oxo-dGTP diphosphatase